MTLTREVRERFKSEPAFTLADLRVFLGSRGTSGGYPKLLVHKMLASGELKRLNRGVFTFADDAQLVGFGYRPFYYGLQNALSLHGLWEQETNPVIVTPRRVRTGLHEYEGTNFLVRRIDRKMFFGLEMMRYGAFWIPVSDVEKTLIDLAYFKEPLSESVLVEFRERIDRDKLDGYLERCSPQIKRLVTTRLKR